MNCKTMVSILILLSVFLSHDVAAKECIVVFKAKPHILGYTFWERKIALNCSVEREKQQNEAFDIHMENVGPIHKIIEFSTSGRDYSTALKSQTLSRTPDPLAVAGKQSIKKCKLDKEATKNFWDLDTDGPGDVAANDKSLKIGYIIVSQAIDVYVKEKRFLAASLTYEVSINSQDSSEDKYLFVLKKQKKILHKETFNGASFTIVIDDKLLFPFNCFSPEPEFDIGDIEWPNPYW